MKLRHPWLLKAAGALAGRAIQCFNCTLRCKTDNNGQPTDPWDPALSERYIYAAWHESILAISLLKSAAPVTGLVSRSKDGELLSQAFRCMKLRTIRGSSSRGGSEAIEEVLQAGKNSHLLIMPDGPRGPRREVTRGLVYLSHWTGMPIVPLGVGFSNAWRLRSWDRFAIPKPFSTVTFVAGPIIEPLPSVNRRVTEACRQQLKVAMQSATQSAQEWALGGKSAPVWRYQPTVDLNIGYESALAGR